jgi:hypothetical protein
MRSPLSRRIDRALPLRDEGPVYTFDIDKTYLDTQWKRAFDIFKLPFELAIDKRPYPGIADLIRACQRGGAESGHDRPAFFLSASPSEMRFVLERRMVLDGLSLDGMTLKNWGYFLRSRKPQRITHQVFYKLTALLTTRLELPQGCFEVLFGDDSESDAFIYSLYSAIIRRALAGQALERTLEQAGVLSRETAIVMGLFDRLDLVLGIEREREHVRHIYIHRLAKNRERPRYVALGVEPKLYSTALEPAAELFAAGLVRGGALSQIYQALRKDNAFYARDALDVIAPTLDPVDARWRENIEDARGLGWGR